MKQSMAVHESMYCNAGPLEFRQDPETAINQTKENDVIGFQTDQPGIGNKPGLVHRCHSDGLNDLKRGFE
jgi:hypothetical protein